MLTPGAPGHDIVGSGRAGLVPASRTAITVRLPISLTDPPNPAIDVGHRHKPHRPDRPVIFGWSAAAVGPPDT